MLKIGQHAEYLFSSGPNLNKKAFISFLLLFNLVIILPIQCTTDTFERRKKNLSIEHIKFIIGCAEFDLNAPLVGHTVRNLKTCLQHYIRSLKCLVLHEHLEIHVLLLDSVHRLFSSGMLIAMCHFWHMISCPFSTTLVNVCSEYLGLHLVPHW